MPGGNGTGPAGAGPMTGRAGGYCAGNGQPGFANPVVGRGGGFGRGRGMGGGFGRGFRHVCFATGLPRWARTGGNAASDGAHGIDEEQVLADQAKALQAQLNVVQTRLEQLGTKSGTEA